MKKTLHRAALICGLALASHSFAQDQSGAVQDAMSQPGGFAQLEALYSLAGRSNASQLQSFIIAADELEDAESRRSALVVLFSRLVHVDPMSAVAMARIPRFANDQRYEAEVWTEWARLDMQSALNEASKLTSTSHRNLVAQAIFAANRQADPDVMQQIIDKLGVRPDLNSQTRFVVQMANRSQEEALQYVNSLPSQTDQQYIVNSLGTYLGGRDAAGAREYADRLRNPNVRNAYLASVERGAGARDPRTAVERALSINVADLRAQETINAMREYARVDARGAAVFLEKIENPTLRAAVENQIVGLMASQDPEFTMDWAQRRDPSGRRGLHSVALAQTAVSSPEAAFSSAMAIESRAARQLAMQRVLSVIGQLEPDRAVELLDQITDKQDLQKAHSMVAQSWIKSDPDAATAWLLGDPRMNEPTFCEEIAPVLVQADIDAARRLLDKLSGNSASILQSHIVLQLAAEHSVQETMQFINSIEDSEQRATLLKTAILPLSQTDPAGAMQVLQSMPASEDRDRLLQLTLLQGAQTNPREAARHVDLVQDDGQRSQIVSAIVAQWYATDQSGAIQWLRTRPRGDEYDLAVVQLAYKFENLGPTQRSLIDDISDIDKRTAAYVGAISAISRNDSARAQQLLQEIPLPAEQRQQLEQQLQRIKDRSDIVFD